MRLTKPLSTCVSDGCNEQAANPLDRLTELMQLRERGALSDSEYEAQKRKLLGQ